MSRATAPVGKLHTTRQAGEILGVCSDTVRAYIAKGWLRAVNVAVKPGDVRWRVTDQAIAEFCAHREYKPPARRRIGAA